MRKTKQFLMILALGTGLSLMSTGCKTGEGCDNQARYAAGTDKDGNLTTKRGKSNLFSKKQRKKMKRPNK